MNGGMMDEILLDIESVFSGLLSDQEIIVKLGYLLDDGEDYKYRMGHSLFENSDFANRFTSRINRDYNQTITTLRNALLHIKNNNTMGALNIIRSSHGNSRGFNNMSSRGSYDNYSQQQYRRNPQYNNMDNNRDRYRQQQTRRTSSNYNDNNKRMERNSNRQEIVKEKTDNLANHWSRKSVGVTDTIKKKNRIEELYTFEEGFYIENHMEELKILFDGEFEEKELPLLDVYGYLKDNTNETVEGVFTVFLFKLFDKLSTAFGLTITKSPMELVKERDMSKVFSNNDSMDDLTYIINLNEISTFLENVKVKISKVGDLLDFNMNITTLYAQITGDIPHDTKLITLTSNMPVFRMLKEAVKNNVPYMRVCFIYLEGGRRYTSVVYREDSNLFVIN